MLTSQVQEVEGTCLHMRIALGGGPLGQLSVVLALLAFLLHIYCKHTRKGWGLKVYFESLAVALIMITVSRCYDHLAASGGHRVCYSSCRPTQMDRSPCGMQVDI